MRSGSSSAHKYSNYSIQSSNFRHREGYHSNSKVTNKFQTSDYPDELFSFDDQMCRRGRNNQTQFAKFQSNPPSDLIAASLIEENSYLKERLRHSDQIIIRLESELSQFRRQLSNQKEQFSYQRESLENKLEEFREEIVAIITSNKQLEAQLKSLKTILSDKNGSKALEKPKTTIRSLDKIYNKENNGHTFHTCDMNNLEGRKIEELIDSIRSMHFKIMGVRVDSLKDLWRWLKGIAHVYSCLRRWQEKFADLKVHSRNEKFRQAVCEVFQILD